MSALANWFHQRLADPRWSLHGRRVAGAASTVLVVSAVTAAALAISLILPNNLPGRAVEALIMSTLLTQRSLAMSVAGAIAPLRLGDLSGAQSRVAHVVGHDVVRLDAAGLARAATGSLANNFSTGVVAPAFWGVLFGLPGVAAYKAICIAHEAVSRNDGDDDAFAWLPARLDALVNIIPARLAALLVSLAAWSRAMIAASATWREARKHRLRNAGWAEAAMAGALGVRLSRPAGGDDSGTEERWFNAGAPDPSAADVAHALRVYVRADMLLVSALALAALIGAAYALQVQS
ncbi:MAG: CobD/CbiB family cobalamin biosynthesis protein [Hyphomonadaceae bacterium]